MLAAALGLMAFLGATASGGAPVPGPRAGDLDTLATWMTGSFSSEAQAAGDSAYFDIRLEMVRIWGDRTDGAWLYVEQAAASSLDRPYRQRVYRVTAVGDTAFRSEVFEIPDPLRFAGSAKDRSRWKAFSPDSLQTRKGCAVILRRDRSGCFAGGTEGRACTSTLRGASYATSQVRVYPDRLETWDRGFDTADKQVWGAEKGPYMFLRKSARTGAPAK